MLLLKIDVIFMLEIFPATEVAFLTEFFSEEVLFELLQWLKGLKLFVKLVASEFLPPEKSFT